MTSPVSLSCTTPATTDSAPPGTADAAADAFTTLLAALASGFSPLTPALSSTPSPATSPGADEADPSAAPTAVEPRPEGNAVGWAATAQRLSVPGLGPAPGERPSPLVGPAPAPPAGLVGAPAPAGLQPAAGNAVQPAAGDAVLPPGVGTEQAPEAEQPPAEDVAQAAPDGPGDRTSPPPRGPEHVTHGTTTRASRPAGEHAPLQRVPAQAPEPPPVAPPDPAGSAVNPTPAGPAGPAAGARVAPLEEPAAQGPRLTPVRHVPHAVLEAVRGLRHEQSGRTSLVVRLDPPELGAVVVRLSVRDGRVDVQLRTPDLGAREGLAAQHHDVEQLLREQGLDLRSFDVSRGELPAGQTGQEGSPDRGTPAGPRAADGPLRDQADVTDDAPAPAAPGTWL